MSDYHQIIHLEQRVDTLERTSAEQREAVLMMARSLERMADVYEHLAERVTGLPVDHIDYPAEDTDAE